MPDENATEVPLHSAYRGANTPPIVEAWERQITSAGSLEAARLQVAYLQLLQLRTIKRVLIFTLVILPALAAVLWIVNHTLAEAS
jgi:hypothetical protein